MDLEATGAVDQVDESGASGLATGSDATGDAMADRSLLAGREIGVPARDLRERLDARELVRERVDALGAQALELRAPRRENLREATLFSVHCAGEATRVAAALRKPVVSRARAARWEPG